MFEKESKEYANKWLEHVKDLELQHKTDDKPEYIRIEEAHQKGAEYGYNKAKVEVEESYRESLCNSELNLASVTERLEELNKANEWHYPSKGELPKCNEETQLIFYVNSYYVIYNETKSIKRTVLGFYKKSFMNDDVKLFVERSKGYEEEHLPKDVIAWKEIVLPKENE